MSIDILFGSLLIVMSRKFILCSISFSLVNYSFGEMLLKHSSRVFILVFSFVIYDENIIEVSEISFDIIV
jgi:hypothetical protein